MSYIITIGMVKDHPEYHEMINDYITEMRANNFYETDRGIEWYENCVIFVLGDKDDKPMSFIMVAPFPLDENESFSLKKFKGNVIVMGAYCKPEHRNKGYYTFLYSKMFQYFRERSDQYKRLLSGYDNNNKISKHVQLKKHNRMVFQIGPKYSRTYTWFKPTWRESMYDLYNSIRIAIGFPMKYDSGFYDKMFNT